MTCLEFGRPATFSQALIRLPKEPYKDSDINLSILGWNLRRCISSCNLTLEERISFLNKEDIGFLEKYSFRRGRKLAGAQWEYVRHDVCQGFFFDTGDNAQQWWKVTELMPELNKDSGYNLICIEANNKISSKYREYCDDEKSEYAIAVIFPEELDKLINEIERNGR